MKYIPWVFLIAITVTPFFADAQLVTCSGGPDDPCGTCEFVQLIKNVWIFLIGIASIIAVIVIVYVGLLLVTSAGSERAKTRAKSYVTNIVIGLIFILAAFAIVDTVIRALVPMSSSLLNWDEVQCIYAIRPQLNNTGSTYDDDWMNDPYIGGYQEGNCSPESFRAAGLPQNVANAFSCFTRNESRCTADAQNPWTSARGILQIVRGLPDDCHSLNNPACTIAAQRAGYNVQGELNCHRAFSGGTSPDNPSHATPGWEELYNACNAAVDNFECSAQAGYCLYRNGGFGHWTAQDDGGLNAQCI